MYIFLHFKSFYTFPVMYMIFNILNLFVLLNLLYCLVLLYSSELFNAGMYFYLMNNKDTGELNFFVRSLQSS